MTCDVSHSDTLSLFSPGESCLFAKFFPVFLINKTIAEEVRGSKTPGPPGSTSYVELAIFVDRDLHRQAVLL